MSVSLALLQQKVAPCISYKDFTYTYETENRSIRVYKDANARLTLDDFFAKLAINFGA